MSSTNNTNNTKNQNSTENRKNIPPLIIKRSRFNSEHESKSFTLNSDTDLRPSRKTIKSDNLPNHNTFFSIPNRFTLIKNS